MLSINVLFASIAVVASFIVAMACTDCLVLSYFYLKVKPMALELLYKSRTQFSFSLRPSIMSTHMMIFSAIYSKVLFEIILYSGLGV